MLIICQDSCNVEGIGEELHGVILVRVGHSDGMGYEMYHRQ